MRTASWVRDTGGAGGGWGAPVVREETGAAAATGAGVAAVPGAPGAGVVAAEKIQRVELNAW